MSADNSSDNEIIREVGDFNEVANKETRWKHSKIYGWVTKISVNRWWGQLDIDGEPYEAEMKSPLPKDIREGSYFTIHRTKRGRTYIYWIRKPLYTKHQMKSARQEARKLLKAIHWEENR